MKGLPLPPMSPQWRDHGKGEGGGGVHIVVCCCNEEHEELKVRTVPCRQDDAIFNGALVCDGLCLLNYDEKN